VPQLHWSHPLHLTSRQVSLKATACHLVDQMTHSTHMTMRGVSITLSVITTNSAGAQLQAGSHARLSWGPAMFKLCRSCTKYVLRTSIGAFQLVFAVGDSHCELHRSWLINKCLPGPTLLSKQQVRQHEHQLHVAYATQLQHMCNPPGCSNCCMLSYTPLSDTLLLTPIICAHSCHCLNHILG
jgi:hypothetical protein